MTILKFLFSLLFILHFSCLKSQHTVYLIGDAGEDVVPGKALRVLQQYLEADSNSTVVFLGDNSYPRGVESDDINLNLSQPYLLPEAAKLYSQLQILRYYKGNVFFVPGNHDWRAQRKNKSWRSIQHERIITESYLADSTKIKNNSEKNYIINYVDSSRLPFCYDVNEKISLLLYDSQFFLQKMPGNSRKMRLQQWDKFLNDTDSIISVKESEGKTVILAAHHPVFTNGNHSKFRQPLRFLFNWTPLYFLGKIGIDRWLSQDIDQPLYKSIRKKYLTMLEKHSGLIIVSGHDHNLQYITETDDHHIISGAGSKLKKLRGKSRFEYAFQNDSKEGFARLKFDSEGGAELEFISDENDILFSKKIK